MASNSVKCVLFFVFEGMCRASTSTPQHLQKDNLVARGTSKMIAKQNAEFWKAAWGDKIKNHNVREADLTDIGKQALWTAGWQMWVQDVDQTVEAGRRWNEEHLKPFYGDPWTEHTLGKFHERQKVQDELVQEIKNELASQLNELASQLASQLKDEFQDVKFHLMAREVWDTCWSMFKNWDTEETAIEGCIYKVELNEWREHESQYREVKSESNGRVGYATADDFVNIKAWGHTNNVFDYAYFAPDGMWVVERTLKDYDSVIKQYIADAKEQNDRTIGKADALTGILSDAGIALACRAQLVQDSRCEFWRYSSFARTKTDNIWDELRLLREEFNGLLQIKGVSAKDLTEMQESNKKERVRLQAIEKIIIENYKWVQGKCETVMSHFHTVNPVDFVEAKDAAGRNNAFRKLTDCKKS